MELTIEERKASNARRRAERVTLGHQVDTAIKRPLAPQLVTIVAEELAFEKWSDEQYRQVDELLVKVALGQPVTPADVALVLSAGKIKRILLTHANNLYGNNPI